MFKKQLVAALIITVVVASLMAAPVFAGNGNNGKSPDELPGWGYGDTNHEHSGPPGLVDTEKPGWGYGDTNHEHTGPQGGKTKNK